MDELLTVLIGGEDQAPQSKMPVVPARPKFPAGSEIMTLDDLFRSQEKPLDTGVFTQQPQYKEVPGPIQENFDAKLLSVLKELDDGMLDAVAAKMFGSEARRGGGEVPSVQTWGREQLMNRIWKNLVLAAPFTGA